MENWEKGKFEQQWSDAMRGGEGEVSPSIWNNIDLALTQAEGGDIRKRLVFYQRLAAASVIFALLVGGSSLYFNGFLFSSSEPSSLASAKSSETPVANTPSTQDNASSAVASAKKEATVDFGEKAMLNDRNTKDKRENATNELTSSSSTVNSSATTLIVMNNHEVIKNEDKALSSSSEKIRERYYSSLALNIPEPEAVVKGSPREVTLWRRLPAFPASFMNDSKKKNTSKENLWASVGASAGSYNPNFTNSGVAAVAVPNAAAGFSSTGYSESSNQGSAYSFGFSMGTRIAKRWVVQGGVNYLNQATDYQSNLISADASNLYKAFVADYQSNRTTLQLTTPYDINSINELVSIPVQAGYLIVDRKFGVQLNTGVATDLFMRNTLVDEAGQVGKFTESAGADSPYRTVSWSGLLGSEFSYKLAEHYRISLVPGLRYSFNSVLKSQSGSISNPVVMDVGFRFRYIFK